MKYWRKKMRCIYCSDLRQDTKLTLEHIWPQALGGSRGSQLFESERLCEICNSLAGIWVDGAFVKAWFTIAEKATSREFLDPDNPGAIPLFYLGIDEEFPVEPGCVCEYWAGPSGEHIYHVHPKDDDRWFGFGGGDFLRRKKAEAGRTYLFLTSAVPYWVITAFKSFHAHFGAMKTRNFCLTKVDGQLPPGLLDEFLDLADSNTIEKSEIAWIKSRPSRGRKNNRIPINIRFSDRFLAKLALGLGSNILPNEFGESAYATKLRKLLWLRPGADVMPTGVLGGNYWQENGLSQASALIGLRGAWSILLRSSRSNFTVSVGAPSGRWMTVIVTDDVDLLSNAVHEVYDDGVLHYVIPQRDIFTPGIPLPDVLSHTMKLKPSAQLAALEAIRCPEGRLPKPR